MAWSVTYLWPTGDTVTSSILNSAIRNNFLAIKPRVVEVSVDIPSEPAHSGNNIDVVISGLAIGDACIIIGRSIINPFFFETEGLVSTAGRVNLKYFNTNPTDPENPAAQTLTFLIIPAAGV